MLRAFANIIINGALERNDETETKDEQCMNDDVHLLTTVFGDMSGAESNLEFIGNISSSTNPLSLLTRLKVLLVWIFMAMAF